MKLGDQVQTADWKKEKHVPLISCQEMVNADEILNVKVRLGEHVAHPNTTEHHIRWIQLYFHPRDEKFSYQIGNYELTSHGECVDGPNKGPVYTHHEVTTSLKINKSGTLYALALCNIHGLWESSKETLITSK